MADNWKHRSAKMKCMTCMWFVIKERVDMTNADDKEAMEPPSRMTNAPPRLGRCRKSAPGPGGWVPVFDSDWCGQHRLDENHG